MENYLYSDLYHKEEKHWWHKSKRNIVIRLLETYLPIKNAAILDAGCGTGKNVEAFSRFGNVTGIDSSNEAIKFCKKRGLQNVFRKNIDKTGFHQRSFDAVTMLDVLEHTDDKRVLKEVQRILKPSGILLLSVPAHKFLWSKWDVVLHHKRRYEEIQLKKLLFSKGYSILYESYLYSFLLLPAFVVRKIKDGTYSNTHYPSDFNLNNPLINYLFYCFAQLEMILTKFIRLPFGTTLIFVARKN